MWTFEHSVLTRAHRTDAWRFWTDMGNHARLEPAVERIELDGPFATGTRGRSVGPGFRQEWTLSDVVDGERFVITGRTDDGAGMLSFAWMFADEGGGTRLTQRIIAEGPDVLRHMDVFRAMEAHAPAAMEALAAELDRLSRDEPPGPVCTPSSRP